MKCSSFILTKPVYDVSAWFRKSGGQLPADAEVLFSPRSKLLYIHSTEDDLQLAETIVWSQAAARLCTMDLRVYLKSQKKEETLFEARGVPIH